MTLAAVVLQEELDGDYEPTEEEIAEYAGWLEMDMEKDADLLWIAKAGLKAALPPPWKPCQTGEDGDIFYFNFETGESIWDHPCDEYHRNLYHRERAKKYGEPLDDEADQSLSASGAPSAPCPDGREELRAESKGKKEKKEKKEKRASKSAGSADLRAAKELAPISVAVGLGGGARLGSSVGQLGRDLDLENSMEESTTEKSARSISESRDLDLDNSLGNQSDSRDAPLGNQSDPGDAALCAARARAGDPEEAPAAGGDPGPIAEDPRESSAARSPVEAPTKRMPSDSPAEQVAERPAGADGGLRADVEGYREERMRAERERVEREIAEWLEQERESRRAEGERAIARLEAENKVKIAKHRKEMAEQFELEKDQAFAEMNSGQEKKVREERQRLQKEFEQKKRDMRAEMEKAAADEAEAEAELRAQLAAAVEEQARSRAQLDDARRAKEGLEESERSLRLALDALRESAQRAGELELASREASEAAAQRALEAERGREEAREEAAASAAECGRLREAEQARLAGDRGVQAQLERLRGELGRSAEEAGRLRAEAAEAAEQLAASEGGCQRARAEAAESAGRLLQAEREEGRLRGLADEGERASAGLEAAEAACGELRGECGRLQEQLQQAEGRRAQESRASEDAAAAAAESLNRALRQVATLQAEVDAAREERGGLEERLCEVSRLRDLAAGSEDARARLETSEATCGELRQEHGRLQKQLQQAEERRSRESRASEDAAAAVRESLDGALRQVASLQAEVDRAKEERRQLEEELGEAARRQTPRAEEESCSRAHLESLLAGARAEAATAAEEASQLRARCQSLREAAEHTASSKARTAEAAAARGGKLAGRAPPREAEAAEFCELRARLAEQQAELEALRQRGPPDDQLRQRSSRKQWAQEERVLLAIIQERDDALLRLRAESTRVALAHARELSGARLGRGAEAADSWGELRRLEEALGGQCAETAAARDEAERRGREVRRLELEEHRSLRRIEALTAEVESGRQEVAQMKKQVADSDSCADQAHAASRAERAARAAAEGRSREQLREVRLLRDQLDEKEHEIGILVGDLRRLRADLAESERGGSGLQRRSRTLDLDDLDDYARLRASARAEGRSAEAVAWGPSETPAAASQDAAPPVPCAWESADRSIGTLTAAELVVLREAKLRQAPLEATPPAAAAAAGTRGAQAAARQSEDAEGLDGTDGRNATPRASGTATPSSWAGGAWGLSPAAGSQRQARAGRSAATTPAEARCWEEGAPGGSATWAAGRDLAVAASACGDEQQALRHWGQLAAGAGLRSAPRAAGASPRSHSPFGVGLRRAGRPPCEPESPNLSWLCSLPPRRASDDRPASARARLQGSGRWLGP